MPSVGNAFGYSELRKGDAGKCEVDQLNVPSGCAKPFDYFKWLGGKDNQMSTVLLGSAMDYSRRLSRSVP